MDWRPADVPLATVGSARLRPSKGRRTLAVVADRRCGGKGWRPEGARGTARPTTPHPQTAHGGQWHPRAGSAHPSAAGQTGDAPRRGAGNGAANHTPPEDRTPRPVAPLPGARAAGKP